MLIADIEIAIIFLDERQERAQKHMVTMVMLRKKMRMIKMSKVEDRCES